jgi:ribosomal protein L32
MSDFSYPEMRRIVYGEDRAAFVPVCPTCGRFVKADKIILIYGDGRIGEPNAECSKCGRVAMPFEGFV